VRPCRAFGSSVGTNIAVGDDSLKTAHRPARRDRCLDLRRASTAARHVLVTGRLATATISHAAAEQLAIRGVIAAGLRPQRAFAHGHWMLEGGTYPVAPSIIRISNRFEPSTVPWPSPARPLALAARRAVPPGDPGRAGGASGVTQTRRLFARPLIGDLPRPLALRTGCSLRQAKCLPSSFRVCSGMSARGFAVPLTFQRAFDGCHRVQCEAVGRLASGPLVSGNAAKGTIK